VSAVLDSLGANAATGRPKPPTLAYTIMVTAGMRGVSPATTAAALETAKVGNRAPLAPTYRFDPT
jgi:hypothetical protein